MRSRLTLTIGRLRVDRLLLLVAAGVLILTLVAATAAAGLRLVRSGSLPGTTVHGTDVGGLSERDLTDALGELARARSMERLRVERPAAGGEPRAVVSARRADMGYHLDVEQTAEAVLARGRQGNPYAALWDHLRAFASDIEVKPAEHVEGEVLSEWAAEAASVLSVEAREGDLRIDGTTVETVYPEAGNEIEASLLARRARAALLSGGTSLEVEAQPVAPVTDEMDVDRIAAQAERALSGPVTLTRGDGSITFTPEEIGKLLVVRLVDEALELRIPPRRLSATLSEERLNELERAPVDARLELSGGIVRVVPSEPGFRLAPKIAARRLLRAATGTGERQAQLRGGRVAPEFTTKDARALDIEEQVSTFTTYHPCCEPRVTNIHLIADMVDGAVVAPGDSFSLNDHVGPRTRDSGFVGAPAIRDGEFVEEVGGGISQFATTMFNAIYFGGYDFLEYQAHSYYIDRYPMGREATISTPAPDLAFRNDSGAGIYIDTSYSDTSITVTLYGKTNVRVESETGEPFNRKDPPEECRVDKDLERGEERVVSPGRSGFDVVVKRILIRGAGREVEEFFTRYQTEPRIVERRRCRD